ncbi:hypothetical protein KP509_38G020600 [Ceratopteris richardii]|uniref:Phytocyanin domain-containing protein n=1 Tax=Ceratopteris richardii TaxID=49495 RepID=A0A8T2Q341_CERRI|nr:hypothetical protein KP509_38G020600 [Ceratopteris richardii]
MARLCDLRFAMAVFMLALPPCIATIYTVGGPAGWTTPSRANVNYTEWASNTPFKVGDTLEFNYVYKAHSVLMVIRSDFRYCNKSNPIMSYDHMSGKTMVKLTKPGNYYFIDGVGDHCELGQKFQARVAGEVLAESAPAAEPVASPAIPPAQAEATSLFSRRIPALVITIALVWLSLQESLL